MKKNRVRNTILRSVISLGLIALFLYLFRDKRTEILQIVTSANRQMLIAAGLVFFVQLIAVAWRLGILLEAEGRHFSLRNVLVLNFYGLFFNNFLPTSVGGDLVKAYYINDHIKNKSKSLSIVFADRVVGLLTFISFAVVAVFLIGDSVFDKDLKIKMLFVALAFLAVPILLVNGKFRTFAARKFQRLGHIAVFMHIRDFFQHLLQSVDDKRKLTKVFLASFIAQAIGFYSVYLLCHSLEADISMIQVVMLLPIVFLSSMMPSINGLGVREGMFIFLFGMYIGRERAFALSILFLAMYLFFSFVGGFLYLIGKKAHRHAA